MKFRTGFDGDNDQVSRDTGLFCPPEEGMTQQHFRDECDINKIVERFGLTGELPDNPRMPVYGDFTGVADYQTCLNAVLMADAAFMELPGALRARFHHSPQALLEFCSDDANREEALKLGLLKPKPEVTRDVVQAVDELSAKLAPKS
ncbi:MAG: internal scaffolding protein [Microvirus sp.]|nr:MAG: internal scaffolding protein [Microvirus sp.]